MSPPPRRLTFTVGTSLLSASLALGVAGCTEGSGKSKTDEKAKPPIPVEPTVNMLPPPEPVEPRPTPPVDPELVEPLHVNEDPEPKSLEPVHVNEGPEPEPIQPEPVVEPGAAKPEPKHVNTRPNHM